MFAILIFLNAHILPIFQPILMILVSKFMVHRAHSDKTYFSLGLLSPLSIFRTHAQKEYRKFLEMKGTYILNILALLLLENLQRFY